MNKLSTLPVAAALTILLLLAGADWAQVALAQGKAPSGPSKPQPASITYTATPVDGLPDKLAWTVAFDAGDRPWVGTYRGAAWQDGDRWQALTTAEGLASNSVAAYLFGEQGRMWIGTDRGLNLFVDERPERTYTWSDGMASSGVQDLALDGAGNLWVAHLAEGVSRFDGEQWRKYTVEDGLADNWVYSIALDTQGSLWFGTLGGVSVFDGESWRSYTTQDGLAGAWVADVAVAADGHLWFATDGGVSEFDGETWTTHLAGRSSRAVAAAEDGIVWAAGSGFVSYWDGKVWREVQPAYFADRLLLALALRGNGEVWVASHGDGVTILTPQSEGAGLKPADGTLWLGTPAGVTMLASGEQRRFDVEDGLAGEDVRDILIDSQGRKWFATTDGASMYDGVAWTSYYPSATGLSSNYVQRVALDPQGRAWFAYGDRGLGVSVKDGGGWRQYTSADGLGDERVYSIAFGPQEQVWVGTANGVYRLNGARWARVGGSYGEDNGVYRALAVSPEGELWAGLDGGVARLVDREWIAVGADAGLVTGSVRALAFDAAGNLWAGAAPTRPGDQDGGLFVFDGDAWTAVHVNRSQTAYTGPAAEPLGDWINDLVVDAEDRLWVGSLRYPLSKPVSVVGGVSVQTGDVLGDVGWVNYTTDNGLVSDYVTALAVDAAGKTWAGTRYGLGVFDGEKWTNYTAAEGLPHLHVTDIAADSAGGVWVTTWGGGAAYYDGEGWSYITTGGLADREVTALAEDREGGIWFATAGGVSHFDGEQWAVYTTLDGLADNYVSAIAVDGRGSVWAGAGVDKYAGHPLSRFDGGDEGGRWTTYTVSDLSYANIAALAVDAQGNPWAVAYRPQQFSSASALFAFDGEQWSAQADPGPLVDDRVYAYEIDPGGRHWFGTDGSYGSHTLLSWDGAEWQSYPIADEPPPVYAIAFADPQRGWLGTEQGLAQMDVNEGTPAFGWNETRRRIAVRAVAVKDVGDAGAEAGGGSAQEDARAGSWLVREDLGEGFQLLAAGPGNSVWALAGDRLLHVDGAETATYNLPPKLAAAAAGNWSVAFPTLTDLAVDGQDQPWVGTREAGLYTLVDGEWQHEPPTALPADTILKLAPDGAGRLWALFAAGDAYLVAYREAGAWNDATPAHLTGAPRGLAATADAVWLAVGGSAPMRWQGGGWEKVLDGWSGSTFDIAAAAGSSGDVWFGNDAGWRQWTGSGWQAPQGTIPAPFSYPVAVDANGGAWGIVTPFCYWCKLPNLNENGAIYATLDGACRFTAADGLGGQPLDPPPYAFDPEPQRRDAVRDIAVSGDGEVWFVANGKLTTFAAHGPVCP